MYDQTNAWNVPGYTEMRDLGTGGAGRVVLARRDSDDKLMAIKYLSAELRADLNFLARFRHEAHLLAMMEPNPHAARFYDYVESPQGAAIVMELVDGVSLRAMLRSEGPTGPEAALTVLKGSLLGLASAHSIGVVHRDYKPENVMVEIDGTSKLVDFGIAARAGEGVSLSGTPPYMAPEQWSGGVAGPATDVYAATIVFFECLTGTRPFRAQNLAALARQHQAMPPPVEQVPPGLQRLIERGMAKHPSDRPASAEAFLRELERVAGDAYGAGWEERGRGRLAALAGLLLPFFPLTGSAPDLGTTLAESESESFGGGLFGKAGIRIGLTTILMAVIAGGTVVLVNSVSDTTPQANTSVVSPARPTAVDTGTPEPEETVPPEPTETPSPSPRKSRRAPSPTPTVTGVPSTTRPPIPLPTRTPSKKPTTAKPKPRPDKSSSPTPEPDETVTATPGGQPGTSQPTMPTGAPTTTLGNQSTSAATETPMPDPATVPVALFAIGLMTTGLVPATLAMKRMTGRLRRRR